MTESLLSAAHTPLLRPADKPFSIMVVDDTPDSLHLLCSMLKKAAFVVRPFPRARLALQAAQDEPPSLFLLDINMPEMTGFELCRKLKQDPVLAEIPIIFISALTETMDKVEAFSCGGLDYVTKPFQMEEVLARVQTHLSLHAYRLELAARNRELQENYHQLQLLEDLRDKLTHMMVHDMRNPLMVVQGYLHLLDLQAQALPNPARMRKVIRDSDSAMRMLLEMISSLLDISRMEENKLELQCDYHDICSLMQQCALAHAALTEMKQLTIQAPDKTLTAWCDDQIFSRIISNLLGNAIKFSPHGSTIELRAVADRLGNVKRLLQNLPNSPVQTSFE